MAKIGRFTISKQVVRDLQRECIEKALADRLGNLRYFGLTSPEMKDVIDWSDLLAWVVAVERGEEGKEHEDQHRLRLTASKHGIQNRLQLLCGNIDRIILTGEDELGKKITYPFDIVSLDYSGGLFYHDGELGQFYRLKAVRKLIREQADFQKPYVLFISANCHAVDTGEVKSAIEHLRTELNRRRWNADHVCDAYLDHQDDRARLKLYVPLFVSQEASAQGYATRMEKVILYTGNDQVQMVSFRFFLKPSKPTAMRRFPQERLSQILNTPCIQIADGKKRKSSLGLPKLTADDAR